MTDLQIEALKTGTDNRRSLMEVMEFLVNRGANTETIRLAMVRAGITEEVARVLSQCVVAPETAAAQANAPTVAAPPSAEPGRGNRVSRRTSGSALQTFLGLIVMVAVIWGVGIVLGSSVGREMGFTHGVQQVKAGFDRVVRVASRQAWK